MKKIIFLSFDETIINSSLRDLIPEVLEFDRGQSLADLKTIQTKCFNERYAEISQKSISIKNSNEISRLLHRIREYDSMHFGFVNSVDSCDVISREFINRTLEDKLNLRGVDIVLSKLDVFEREMYGNNIPIILSLFDILDSSIGRGVIEITLVDGNQQNIDCFKKLSDSNHRERCIRYISDNKLRDNFELSIDSLILKFSEFNFMSPIHVVEGKDYISRISRFLNIDLEGCEILKMDYCQSIDSYESERADTPSDNLSTIDTQSRKKSTVKKFMDFINRLKFIPRGRELGYSIVPESDYPSSSNVNQGLTSKFLNRNTNQRRYSILSDNSNINSSQNDNLLSETKSFVKDRRFSGDRKMESYDNSQCDYMAKCSYYDLSARDKRKVDRNYSMIIKERLKESKDSSYMLSGSYSDLTVGEKGKLIKDLSKKGSGHSTLFDDNEEKHKYLTVLGKANYSFLNEEKGAAYKNENGVNQRRKEKSVNKLTLVLNLLFKKKKNCVSLENIFDRNIDEVQSLISNPVNEPLLNFKNRNCVSLENIFDRNIDEVQSLISNPVNEPCTDTCVRDK